MRHPELNQRGFSLLEVVVAMLVAMIALLGLHSMTIAVSNTVSVAQNLSVATVLGQDILEEVKSAEYESVAVSSFPAQDYGDIAGHENFSRVVTVVDDSPEAGMKTVSVTVGWTGDLDGTAKSVTLATIISDE